MLLGLREFEPEKADVIHKYTAEEVRNIQPYEYTSFISQFPNLEK